MEMCIQHSELHVEICVVCVLLLIIIGIHKVTLTTARTMEKRFCANTTGGSPTVADFCRQTTLGHPPTASFPSLSSHVVPHELGLSSL